MHAVQLNLGNRGLHVNTQSQNQTQGWSVFIFFKRSFRYENDDEKTKNDHFKKTTVFKKLVVSLEG